MSTTLILSLTHISCAKCGLVFGIEASHEERLRRTHAVFYCPSGHNNYFPGQTEQEKRIAELGRSEKALAANRDYWRSREESTSSALRHKESQVNGYKGVVTRFKRRFVAARCPCCSHQFKDLERHMKNQHPKYDPDRAAIALAEKSGDAQP